MYLVFWLSCYFSFQVKHLCNILCVYNASCENQWKIVNKMACLIFHRRRWEHKWLVSLSLSDVVFFCRWDKYVQTGRKTRYVKWYDGKSLDCTADVGRFTITTSGNKQYRKLMMCSTTTNSSLSSGVNKLGWWWEHNKKK